MGKLIEYRDMDHWLCADEQPGKKIENFRKEKRVKLPAPYNRSVDGGVKESKIQKQTLAALRSAGYFVTRLGVDIHVAQTSKDTAVAIGNPLKGWPDLFVIRDGIFHGIELKKQGGSLSAQQINVLVRLSHEGSPVCVALSPTGALNFMAGLKHNAEIISYGILIPIFE
jgi:hypothetical protein